jgi:hypothetical protein
MRKTILGRALVMKKTFLILALVLILVPATVFAGDVSVLIGPQTVSFGADMGEYYDIPTGTGYTLLVGLDLGMPLDVRVGRRTATDGNGGADITYQWIEFGPRFVIGEKTASIRGDLFLGVGSYDLERDSFEYDTALGGYIGMGVEEQVSGKFMGRIEAKAVYWKSDTYNTDGATLNIALLFGFKL